MSRVLITLGPTRERIDDVRFISNASSGKMGLALAREALSRGHDVTIISGPVTEAYPPAAAILPAMSARDMLAATLDALEKTPHDLVIATAAVADYTAESITEGKISSGRKRLQVVLTPTKKITAEVKRRFPSLPVVAFKAESNLSSADLRKKAMQKISRERLNLIVANDISKHPMGAESSEYTVYTPKGNAILTTPGDKSVIAAALWDVFERYLRL